MTIADRFDLGYWPSSLFPLLSDSAEAVKWGGEVINLHKGGQHTTTQMGSGHFAEEGPNKASFFKNLNVIDGKKLLRAPWHTHTFTPIPIAIISKIMDTTFTMVVLVETPIVHDHLDYSSKIKEKEGSIRRGELFSSSSSLHVTPNVPTIKLSDSLI